MNTALRIGAGPDVKLEGVIGLERQQSMENSYQPFRRQSQRQKEPILR